MVIVVEVPGVTTIPAKIQTLTAPLSDPESRSVVQVAPIPDIEAVLMPPI